MGSVGGTAASPRFLLISYPRSASNLLRRVLALEDRDDVHSDGYLLAKTTYTTMAEKLWAKPLGQWDPDAKANYKRLASEGLEALNKSVAEGEASGKIVYVKEHVLFLLDPNVMDKFIFGEFSSSDRPWRIDQPDVSGGADPAESDMNETIFSDEYLQQWKATFLIRHPAMAFPSQYRALTQQRTEQEESPAEKNFLSLFMTLRWSRKLYDHYTELERKAAEPTEPGQELVSWPVILDADDVMESPAVMQKYALAIGVSPTKVQYEWKAADDEQREKMSARAKIMLSTLIASDGIVAGKSASKIDIRVEAEKWREEFGQEVAERLEAAVLAAMPDYEYMRSRRLQA
ncbi:hypothetical protein NQ176_g2353 [Zarea fungicola]|uniref:Uncharacterized protein n=1 Tax=Zarea fungicola TaxID=93591 RepID=A0ACC1NNJ0_9HYPO|nr:hypothetical protein NQ176_g2353 [Lecanicillium fungicola]